MSDFEEICTNSYTTEAFDNDDARTGDRVRGTMHGPVKEYTQEEIKQFIEARKDGLI